MAPDGSASRPRTRIRRTRAPGERARARVLAEAARLATIEGIDGLTIGRLAGALDMPKSSLYVLFGAKEDLQLATVDVAMASLQSEVIGPALATLPPGRDRLHALCEGFLSYVERRVFPGGCFFVAASAELGGRPGRVHDRVAGYQAAWSELLASEAAAAVQLGQLPPDTDPGQLAFELSTMLAGANIVSVLHDDADPIRRARTAVARLLAGPS